MCSVHLSRKTEAADMQETSALQTKEEVVPGRRKHKKLIPFLSAGRLDLALESADFPGGFS